jgi:hypothetical protein
VIWPPTPNLTCAAADPVSAKSERETERHNPLHFGSLQLKLAGLPARHCPLRRQRNGPAIYCATRSRSRRLTRGRLWTGTRRLDYPGPTSLVVTNYLVVHKGQIPCTRYCIPGHQTPCSRHQQRRGPSCCKLADEHSYRLADERGFWNDADAGRAALRTIAVKSAIFVLLNIFAFLVELRDLP